MADHNYSRLLSPHDTTGIFIYSLKNKSSRVTTEYPDKFLRCFSTPEDTPFFEKIMYDLFCCVTHNAESCRSFNCFSSKGSSVYLHSQITAFSSSVANKSISSCFSEQDYFPTSDQDFQQKKAFFHYRTALLDKTHKSVQNDAL